MRINDTLRKFGYPDTLIHRYQHWSVLLRPQQITLGSIVLAAHSEVTQFSQLDKHAISELAEVSADIENTLRDCFDFDKVNYLMLMMVDPHVHMHVIPRYEKPREFNGYELIDKDWPLPPDLTQQVNNNEIMQAGLLEYLRDAWVK